MKTYRVKTLGPCKHKLEKSFFGLFYYPIESFKTVTAANNKCRKLNCGKKCER